MQAAPWASYSSVLTVVPSNSTLVNCRAIYCTAAGSLVVTVGPPGSPTGPFTFPMTAGQILPLELNQGIIGAASTGSYLALA